MRARPTALAAALALALVPASAAPAAEKPSRTGPYQTMGNLPRDWSHAADTKIHRGLPLSRIPGTDTYARNPTTISQWGLANYSIWTRYEDKRRFRSARRAANWLVKRQDAFGGWGYPFAFTPNPMGAAYELPVGWISGLAQGQALSLLRRIYHVTEKRRYRRAAADGLRPFKMPIERGGIISEFDGRPWFEEYPTREKQLIVLNGHTQALTGVYDMIDLLPAARRIYRRGHRSLVKLLPLFDTGDAKSYYSLGHLAADVRPIVAPLHYHQAHVQHLREINQQKPNEVLVEYADRWTPYAESAR